MPATATDYREAIEHLPPGAVLGFEDVSWEDYENLLAELGDSTRKRIFYHRGRMEVVAPSYEHDKPADILHRLIFAISDELDIDVEGCGQTTLKVERKESGAEADGEFYIQHAADIIVHESLDLAHDPPPDLVIEVDRASSSINKFGICAALGVPEIWRLSKDKLTFHELFEDHYQESLHSRAFRFLTPEVVMTFVNLGAKQGERKAAKAFRAWISETQTSK